ncbi:MAG: nitroreductase [Bacteroidales bacterium]|nr:nitroreductase [Bacteroidales bacterium]
MKFKVDFEVVKARHSVRSYTDDPVTDEQAENLRQLLDEANQEGGVHMQLVLDDPKAFGKSITAHYGSFRNVMNYIALVAPKGKSEELGYYGEMAVLRAQELGLHTCWVALTYSKRNTRCDVAPDEKIYGVISLGRGVDPGHDHKTRSVEEIGGVSSESPEWYKQAIEWVRLAPSALNQQLTRFRLQPDGTVTVKSRRGFCWRMDMGIAKLHFDLGKAAEPKDNG